MMIRSFFSATIMALFVTAVAMGQASVPEKTKSGTSSDLVAAPNAKALKSETVPGAKPYDPNRNAAADVKEAMLEAERTGRRVMVEVGGEWCIWCHRMDEFFAANPELIRQRDANFVLVKVNYSDENKNEAFLSGYPPVPGYPHIFILNADGTLVQSQDTGDLEDGKKSYNLDKLTAFLKKWSPEHK